MIVTIGIGCKRDAPADEVLDLVRAALAEARVAPGAVACIATLDRKEGEAAINTLAVQLGVPVRFFSANELATETRIAHPSESVAEAIETPSVAEAAALLAAGPGAKLIVPKRKSAHATCAIAATGDTP